jgi:hypothetical protein
LQLNRDDTPKYVGNRSTPSPPHSRSSPPTSALRVSLVVQEAETRRCSRRLADHLIGFRKDTRKGWFFFFVPMTLQHMSPLLACAVTRCKPHPVTAGADPKRRNASDAQGAGPAAMLVPALLTGHGRGGVIRLIHSLFRVSYFIQIQRGARIKFANTGRFTSPQLPGARSCCAYQDPSRAHHRWGLFHVDAHYSAGAKTGRDVGKMAGMEKINDRK